MATFTSPTSFISAPAEKVYARFSNLENLSSLLANIPADKVPADQRSMLDNIQVDAESITLPAGPAGTIRLVMADRVEPTLICLRGEGAPVPLSVSLHIAPLSSDSCETSAEVDIEIPMMMLPMIKGALQKMVDQIGAIIPAIPYND